MSFFEEAARRYRQSRGHLVGGSPHARGKAVVQGYSPGRGGCPKIILIEDGVELWSGDANTNKYSVAGGANGWPLRVLQASGSQVGLGTDNNSEIAVVLEFAESITEAEAVQIDTQDYYHYIVISAGTGFLNDIPVGQQTDQFVLDTEVDCSLIRTELIGQYALNGGLTYNNFTDLALTSLDDLAAKRTNLQLTFTNSASPNQYSLDSGTLEDLTTVRGWVQAQASGATFYGALLRMTVNDRPDNYFTDLDDWLARLRLSGPILSAADRNKGFVVTNFSEIT